MRWKRLQSNGLLDLPLTDLQCDYCLEPDRLYRPVNWYSSTDYFSNVQTISHRLPEFALARGREECIARVSLVSSQIWEWGEQTGAV